MRIGKIAASLALYAVAPRRRRAVELARPPDPHHRAVHRRAAVPTSSPASMAEPLSKALGQPVMVENRGGAGGTVGAAQVAKAAPDGYTLLVHSAGHVANSSIYSHLPYDTIKDFAGVTPLASLPNVLVTSPSKG